MRLRIVLDLLWLLPWLGLCCPHLRRRVPSSIFGSLADLDPWLPIVGDCCVVVGCCCGYSQKVARPVPRILCTAVCVPRSWPSPRVSYSPSRPRPVYPTRSLVTASLVPCTNPCHSHFPAICIVDCCVFSLRPSSSCPSILPYSLLMLIVVYFPDRR